MRIGYLDCFSGMAGDMFLAAMVDAGLDVTRLREAFQRLDVPGLDVRAERSQRSGLSGTRVVVVGSDPQGQPHRRLADIVALLQRAGLDPEVHERALSVFEELARAEAKVHGCSIGEVHFHEVGAVDSIADIVGACFGLRALGIERLYASEVALGKGYAQTAHGRIPVPVMATTEILRGVPVRLTDIEGELVTPTGAALLKTLVARFGRGLSILPQVIGYGLGARDRASPPNAVRLIIGEQDRALESLVLLEANIDDASGQVLGYAFDRLLEGGALDVTITPIVMKKSRPAHKLSVLCDESSADRLTTLMLLETPTLGVRRHSVSRWHLERQIVNLPTSIGPVRVKEARLPDGTLRRMPEYDDLRDAARRTGRPLLELLARVRAELDGRNE